MPQFGASQTDDARVVIYDHNVFIIQATGPAIQHSGARRLNFFHNSPE